MESDPGYSSFTTLNIKSEKQNILLRISEKKQIYAVLLKSIGGFPFA